MKDSMYLKCLKVHQPIGDFYISSIKSMQLESIAFADMCKLTGETRSDIVGLEDVSVDEYTGWQRQLNKDRVKEIKQFVQQPDACFPTGIILSVDERCANWDEKNSTLELHPYSDPKDERLSIPKGRIARILDGQHRLSGLKGFASDFDLNVSIFVGLDVAEQAYIFSMVNLAQTKVNKSLVYELFDFAKRRSPQKLCHQIAVALDAIDTSPFFKRIKRLGCATPNRENETITQATFVKALMPYLTEDENADRKRYAECKSIELGKSDKTIFRRFMKDEQDMELTKILYNYFLAVRKKWPKSWAGNERGQMLNKSNGFMALMRFLGIVYPEIQKHGGDVPTVDAFYRVFEKSRLKDGEFSTEIYMPGSTGESALYRALMSDYDVNSQG